MEEKYMQVKKSLEKLGYKYELSNESLPLVERLLSDLVQTTNSLRKYMTIAKEAVEERDTLLLGAEPYRCDNAKLVKECNDLHASLTRFREQSEKTQYELQKKLSALQREKQSCDSEHWKNIKRIKELELQHARRDHKSVRIQERIGKTVPCTYQSTSILNSNKGTSSKELPIRSAMVLADEKVAHLSKEVSRLKDEKLELAEANECLKNKINTREKEVQRLMELLQGGRPRSAVNEDCCYKNLEPRLESLQEEIDYLKKCKRDSEEKFKGALAKQHEAMQRAMHLADRNKQLEKELKDIDQIALTVEADCNSTVISNSDKINRLQERVHHCIIQIQNLERENMELKRDKCQYQGDSDALRHEKQQLQSMLETVLEEKRRVTERLNQASIIEKDLNIEIDRLTRLGAQQRRSLVEKGIQFVTSDREGDATNAAKVEESDLSDYNQKSVSQKKKKGKKLKKPKSRSPSPKLLKQNISPKLRQSATIDVRSKHLNSKSSALDANRRQSPKALPKVDPLQMRKHYGSLSVPQNTPANRHDDDSVVDKDHDDYDTENVKDKHRPEKDCRFEKLETERDFYAREYHNLMEQFRNIPSKLYTGTVRDNENERLKELEKQLRNLRFEKDSLFTDKQMLISKLQSIQDSAEEMDGLSLKSNMKRLERERDLLKSELSQLEDERNELRKQFTIVVDSHAFDNKKLEKIVLDTEEQIRKIEREKQELLKVSGAKYSNIRGLEDQCDTLREQLKLAQVELTQQRAIYTQLKSLLEQTDRSLSDCQGQLNQAENELAKSQAIIDAKDNEQKALKEEINNLKRDIKSLKGNVNHIDQEKDSLLNNLDDKTEQISALQIDLKQKNMTISSLENNLTELQKKLNLTKDDSLTRDYKLKVSSSEITNLKEELEAALRSKDLALQENRRLQEDLASCAADIRSSRTELDQTRRQVDDLKRQLQHYVAEVKRAEDLISHKEVERSEMLDQFRSLSEEATHLETNNHTLESEASQSRVQMSVALDHATELERKLEEQVELVRGYERQMSELTGQVASLEVQLRQRYESTGKSDTELASLRDLCVKLDKQKDSMIKQLDEHTESKYQFEREIDRLKRDMDKMRASLTNEQKSVDNVEKLLSESRQDTVEQRLLNQELQGEVQRLKTKVQELQSKLQVTTDQLDIYQEKALDYSQQNKQLRREIANERFSRTLQTDETKQQYPSLSFCKQQLGEKDDEDIKDAEIENERIGKQRPTAKRDSLAQVYTSNLSTSQDSRPNNQLHAFKTNIPVDIIQTHRNSIEQRRLSKQGEFEVRLVEGAELVNKPNESIEFSVPYTDMITPRYESIMSPVNDYRYINRESSNSSAELARDKSSKVRSLQDHGSTSITLEVSKTKNEYPNLPQIVSESENLVLNNESRQHTESYKSSLSNPKNSSTLDPQDTLILMNGNKHYDEASNVAVSNKLGLPSGLNSNDNNANSGVSSQNENMQYYNPTILNFDEASNVTLSSKVPLIPALKSKETVIDRNSEVLPQPSRFPYYGPSDPNYDEASKVTLYSKLYLPSTFENDVVGSRSEILSQYGRLHYRDPSQPNYDEASKITLKSTIHLEPNTMENISADNTKRDISVPTDKSKESVTGLANEPASEVPEQYDILERGTRTNDQGSNRILDQKKPLPGDSSKREIHNSTIIKNNSTVTNSVDPISFISKIPITNVDSINNFNNENDKEAQILSDYDRTYYLSPSDINFDNASRITMYSKLHIPQTQYDSHSKLNEENTSNILSQYGRLHYRDPLAPNFEDASRITVYSKSDIQLHKATENNATGNVSHSQDDLLQEVFKDTIIDDVSSSQSDHEASKKMSENIQELSCKLNEKTKRQEREISKSSPQYSSAVNDIVNNHHTRKTSMISNNMSTSKNRGKVLQGNNKQSRKFSKDSNQLSNSLNVNSINKQGKTSEDSKQSLNKINDLINLKSQHLSTVNSGVQHGTKAISKLSQDSRQLSHKSKPSSNFNDLINQDARKSSIEDSEQLATVDSGTQYNTNEFTKPSREDSHQLSHKSKQSSNKFNDRIGQEFRNPSRDDSQQLSHKSKPFSNKFNNFGNQDARKSSIEDSNHLATVDSGAQYNTKEFSKTSHEDSHQLPHKSKQSSNRFNDRIGQEFRKPSREDSHQLSHKSKQSSNRFNDRIGQEFRKPSREDSPQLSYKSRQSSNKFNNIGNQDARKSSIEDSEQLATVDSGAQYNTNEFTKPSREDSHQLSHKSKQSSNKFNDRIGQEFRNPSREDSPQLSHKSRQSSNKFNNFGNQDARKSSIEDSNHLATVDSGAQYNTNEFTKPSREDSQQLSHKSKQSSNKFNDLIGREFSKPSREDSPQLSHKSKQSLNKFNNFGNRDSRKSSIEDSEQLATVDSGAQYNTNEFRKPSREDSHQLSHKSKQYSNKFNDFIGPEFSKPSREDSPQLSHKSKQSLNKFNNFGNQDARKSSIEDSEQLATVDSGAQYNTKEFNKTSHEDSHQLPHKSKQSSNKFNDLIAQEKNQMNTPYKSSQLSNKFNARVFEIPDVYKQTPNTLTDNVINRNIRKTSDEAQHLSNELNKNVRRSNKNYPEHVEDGLKTTVLSYPENQTNDNIIHSKYTSSVQPINDTISLRRNNYTSQMSAPHESSQNDEQYNMQEHTQPKRPKKNESDKPFDTIRHRTEYARYFGIDLQTADHGKVSSTISSLSANPLVEKNISFVQDSSGMENERKLSKNINDHIAKKDGTLIECDRRDHYQSDQGTQNIDRNTPGHDGTQTNSQYEKHDHFENSDGSLHVDYNAKLRKSKRCPNLKDDNAQSMHYCDCPEHINVDVHFDITNATCRHLNSRFAPYDCVCITQGMNTDINDIKKTFCLANDAMVRDFLITRSSAVEISTNIGDAYSSENIAK